MSMVGNLRDMAIADLIQHNCQERKTARLSIQSGDHLAVLFFKDGNLHHAETDELEGEEVIYQILDWEDGTFHLETGIEPPVLTIHRSWSGLLLEGARRIDENRQEVDIFEFNHDFSGKDGMMNIKRLNKILDDVKEDLGTALVASDIWNIDDGQSLAGFNTQPKATALFNEITRYLNKALRGAEFPGLGKYYLVHLENNFLVVVVSSGTLQQGVLVDLSKTTLGLLMNITLPKIQQGLAEGLK